MAVRRRQRRRIGSGAIGLRGHALTRIIGSRLIAIIGSMMHGFHLMVNKRGWMAVG
jgi:hypothetical protein